MPVIHIEPPTEEEIRQYHEQKHKEFLESFSNKDKMTRIKPLGITVFKGIKVGICPKCNHCVMPSDSFCDECFQRLDWNEVTHD